MHHTFFTSKIAIDLGHLPCQTTLEDPDKAPLVLAELVRDLLCENGVQHNLKAIEIGKMIQHQVFWGSYFQSKPDRLTLNHPRLGFRSSSSHEFSLVFFNGHWI